MGTYIGCGKPPVFLPPLRDRHVVHLDDDVVVLDKPAGWHCHPHRDEVPLADRLNAWLAANGHAPDARLVEPLEHEASGVVLFGRTKEGRRRLSDALQAPHQRRWVFAGRGAPPAPGGFEVERLMRGADERVLVALARHRSKPAMRRWLAEEHRFQVAGDRDQKGPLAARVLLHLSHLRWDDPGPKEVFAAPLPPAFGRWIEYGFEAEPAHDLFSAGGSWPWIERLIEDAVDRRFGLSQEDTNAYRLVHGAGDGLTGIEVDRYDEHLIIALRSPWAEAREAKLIDLFDRTLKPAGIYIKRRPVVANTLVDTRRPEVAPGEAVSGVSAPSPLVIREHGVTFDTYLGDGLSTGLFLDQRDARAWLREHAQGKRFLNLFCYHAAFTVAAIAGGARESLSIDSAAPALARAEQNLLRLGIETGGPHRLLRSDCFRWLEQDARTEPAFDVIVVDPPSYATVRQGKRRKTVFRADKDYPRLLTLALPKLSPDGVMLASTNHRQVSPPQFERMARNRGACRIERLPAPSDHPPPPDGVPHLKRLLIRRDTKPKRRGRR